MRSKAEIDLTQTDYICGTYKVICEWSAATQEEEYKYYVHNGNDLIFLHEQIARAGAEQAL